MNNVACDVGHTTELQLLHVQCKLIRVMEDCIIKL